MRLCKFPGCDEPHKARGFCAGHYQVWLRRGCVAPIKRRQEPVEPIKPPVLHPWGDLQSLMEKAPVWSGKKGSHR